MNILLKIKSAIGIALVCFLMIGFSSCHCDHECEPKAPFKVGHVLCTDGTVLSLCEYVKSTKQAAGIVFHVNESPDSAIMGYAVYINKNEPKAFADSCGVSQGTSASLSQLDGNTNTYAIYKTQDVRSPMAELVFDLWRYGQSAYIPSVAELRLLRNNLDFVNERILAVGGDPISDDFSECWLWSSTEVEGQEADKAWLFSMNYGDIHETPKNQPHQVRPIVAIRK